MNIPKVFVSYSHDSREHKKWVLDLATRLRSTGIDALIDQWELKPGDDLAHFMEQNLAAADHVVMICTKIYVEKANAGIGGVGYEKMIITSDLIKRIDSNKVIPVIRQSGTREVPTFLKTKLFIDFSRSDDFEFGFDELIRTVHNAPIYKKPKIGVSPFGSTEQPPAEKGGDALRELVAVVVMDYELGSNFSSYGAILKALGISRIMFELLTKEAEDKGLLVVARRHDSISLTAKGKFYAVEHGLIDK